MKSYRLSVGSTSTQSPPPHPPLTLSLSPSCSPSPSPPSSPLSMSLPLPLVSVFCSCFAFDPSLCSGHCADPRRRSDLVCCWLCASHGSWDGLFRSQVTSDQTRDCHRRNVQHVLMELDVLPQSRKQTSHHN